VTTTTTTVAAATSSTETAPPSTTAAPFEGLRLETVAGGLDLPVFAAAPAGDDRLFVVEKPGRVRIVRNGGLASEPFLDIAGEVGSAGLEQGLLGLAFHPGYTDNGRLFVYFTDRSGASRLAEVAVSDDPDRADPASLRVLLTEPQPAANHNGGMIEFGPDGYLYVAFGDGGGANDRFGNGQRPDTRLGTLLRIDVDGGDPYVVPPDNPYVAGGGALEVWAYGLRNPWRFTIDPVDDLIYIGDVGQERWEEVIVAPTDLGGLNYGWPIMEGFECFRTDGCDATGLTPPELVYDHGEGCSVIGGYVYRGSAIPELEGHYLYGDWCGGWVRSFRFVDGEATELRDWTEDLGSPGQVLSFGRDGAGELYLLTQEGLVHRIVADR
jgi:glucose/arabinose dehydrogenase